jgi:hypothetical protein
MFCTLDGSAPLQLTVVYPLELIEAEPVATTVKFVDLKKLPAV